jgi:hypothetical protein
MAPNIEAETAVWRDQGYMSFPLGESRRFTISEKAIQAAFSQHCEARQYPPPCDSFDRYYWKVRIDENVELLFLHKDPRKSREEAVPGFSCYFASGRWDCMAESR